MVNWEDKFFQCNGTGFQSSCLLVVIYMVFWTWRRFFSKVRVNCWFCDNNFIVRYQSKNNWYCPGCQQYNGFTRDGDYNCSIPNMHNEVLNKATLAVGAANHTSFNQHEILCSKCSQNQLLKVKQLSQFEPLNKDSFDEEVKVYEEKLEKLYSLCSYCKDAIDRHIKMQDTIIRGSMISRNQQLKVQKNLSENTQRYKNETFISRMVLQKDKNICAAFWFVVFILSLLNVCCEVIGVVLSAEILLPGLKQVLNVLQHQDILSGILVLGFSLGIASMSLQKSRSLVNIFCAWAWLMHCIFVVVYPSWNIFSKTFVTISESTSQELLTDKEPIDKVKISGLHHSCFWNLVFFGCKASALILSSFFSYFHSVNCLYMHASLISPEQEHATEMHQKKPEQSIYKTPVEDQDVEMYSDCSISSEGELTSLQATKQHLLSSNPNNSAVATEIHGSLNALNLQDKCIPSASCNFRQTACSSTPTALPSTLHTPPPSRSSSLLSLSSHQSGHGYASGASMLPVSSSAEFVNPNGVIASKRFGAKTVVECNSKCWNKRLGRSVVSYPAMSWQKSSLVSSIKQGHKPLISPAKLNWQCSMQKRNMSQNNIIKPSYFPAASQVKTNMPNWNLKPDVDLSFSDSVSQAGERNRFELSDDEDNSLCRTPRRQDSNATTDWHSSSPNSVVSNISSATLKGIEKVEKSRLCRWILIICLLLNFVLVVLLVMEVKEMRDVQQWKSSAKL